MSGGVVAGVGCRRGCAAAEIVALVREAEARCGCRVKALAAPAFKREEAGLRDAAALLGVVLHFVDTRALEEVQPLCPTRSGAALRARGVASVAEGAALAASGGTLLLTRIGTARATCALARGDGGGA